MKRFFLPVLLILTSCAAFPSGKPVRTDFASADVLRSLDDAGVSRNDQCTITDRAALATLQGFFPDVLNGKQSTVPSRWMPWIIVRFRSADGTATYVASDYRNYRVGDGTRGNFVVKQGFPDFVNALPLQPPPGDKAIR